MKKLSIHLLAFVALFSVGALLVHAQGNTTGGGPTNTTGGGPTISTTIPNPFKKAGGNAIDLLETIIKEIVLPIGGVIAVLMFIYTGFLFVTAQGDKSKVGEARASLVNTSIGTAVLLGSYVIAEVIKTTVNQLR